MPLLLSGGGVKSNGVTYSSYSAYNASKTSSPSSSSSSSSSSGSSSSGSSSTSKIVYNQGGVQLTQVQVDRLWQSNPTLATSMGVPKKSGVNAVQPDKIQQEKTTPTTTTSTSTKDKDIDLSEVRTILNSTSLSADEKAAIEAVYQSVASGDQANAEKLVANLKLAKTYADPILARQIALITDDLNRTVEGMDYDLEYQEKTLETNLKNLRDDVAFQKNNLSIEQQQELKDLDTYYNGQLETTRDTMAAQGFTSSSRRVKKEKLLSDQKGSLVESTNRKFGTQRRNLEVGEERSEYDTAREVERLREMTSRGKLDLARGAEGQLGSNRVAGMDSLNDIDTLGNITGQVDLDYQNSLADFVF